MNVNGCAPDGVQLLGRWAHKVWTFFACKISASARTFRPLRHVRADGDACLCNEDYRVRHLCAPSGGEDLGTGRRLRKQHGSFRLCR